LLQPLCFLGVTSITHSRHRVPPAYGRLVSLPRALIGVAEVAEGPTLAETVADLPEGGKRILVAGNGLLKPPQLLVVEAEVVQGLPSPRRSPVSR